MSESKFVMAQKLSNVQKALMEMEIQDMSLDSLISLIFEKCSLENLTFWFNFYEHEVVLNLRDVSHDNYELNIRQYYETIEDVDSIKLQVLTNAFHLTKCKLLFEDNEASSETLQKEENHNGIISSDKVTPKPIREAINTIKSKGIDVTGEAIKNHVMWSQLSVDQRIKCTNYLNQMKEAQE